jgi:predicted site-specific integrase-resolvase
MATIIAAPTEPTRQAGDLLTDQQAAAILSVEPRTLRLWRNTRSLPYIRITSKVIRYRRSDLEAWLDRSRTVIAA